MRSLLIIIAIIALLQPNAYAQYAYSGNPRTTSVKNTEQRELTAYNDSLLSAEDIEWNKHLIINSDSRVDSLIKIHREENLRKKGFDGYRVQIFQGSMEEARRVEAKFLSMHDNIKTEIKFDAPYARLKAGNFRTRSEAIKLKQLLKSEYPASFVVEDIVYFPELLTDKAEN